MPGRDVGAVAGGNHMISRQRLHDANRHALRRWRAIYRGESEPWRFASPWQRFRKLTAPCSCLACGNPRRYGELTRQERRAIEAAAGDA